MRLLQRLAAAALAAVGPAACAGAPGTVRVDVAVPADFPAQGFSHDRFEALLRRFVVAGRIDYAAWHADAAAVRELDAYLAALAAYSPTSAPDRFLRGSERLAYWLIAYNAFVIKGVLLRWPLARVIDVKAGIEPTRGYGFFYRQKFITGGRRISLYAIENTEIRGRFEDPRIHFVLNCGSESCPVIRPELPTGAALEPFLARAAREFVGDPRNVRVDHAGRVLLLSEIFEWYRVDFVQAVRRAGRPTTHALLEYLRLVGDETLREMLAQVDDYRVQFIAYDWAVNEASP